MMKRSWIFVLMILALVFVSSSASLAAPQFGEYSKTYSKFTLLNIPAGWEALDEESDSTVTIRHREDRNTFVSIYIDKRGNFDIIDIANRYRQELGGPDAIFADQEAGQDYYSFLYSYSANVRATAYVLGSNYNPYLPTDSYCLIKRSEDVSDYDFIRICYSLVFDASQGEKFKKFTTYNFPGDWVTSENQSTGEVTYEKSSNRNIRVSMLIEKRNRVTLTDIANNAVEEYDGTVIRESQGLCAFTYTREGSSYLAWVIDQNYVTNIPSDYYCFVRGTNNNNVSVEFPDFYSIIFSTVFHPEGSGSNTGDDNGITNEARENISEFYGVDEATINFVEELGESITPSSLISNAITQEGYELVSSPGSVSVNNTGYTVFPVTIPASLRGLSGSEAKIYIANRNDTPIAGGVSVIDSALPAGMSEATIFNLSGRASNTLSSSVLACADLPDNGVYSIHLAKVKSSSQPSQTVSGGSGGGCNAGTGLFASLMIALSSMILRKR